MPVNGGGLVRHSIQFEGIRGLIATTEAKMKRLTLPLIATIAVAGAAAVATAGVNQYNWVDARSSTSLLNCSELVDHEVKICPERCKKVLTKPKEIKACTTNCPTNAAPNKAECRKYWDKCAKVWAHQIVQLNQGKTTIEKAEAAFQKCMKS